MQKKKVKKSALEINISIGRVSLAQKALFAKHLSVMLKSGLTITEALGIAANSAQGKLKNIIKSQANIKEIEVLQSLPGIEETIKADYSQIGPDFGKKSPQIIAKLTSESPKTILNHIEKEVKITISLDKEKIKIVKKHLIVAREVPQPYIEAPFKSGFVYLNRELDEDLEAEGYTRELMRRVQDLRKKAGLQKKDRISLFIKTDEELMNTLNNFHSAIKGTVGASTLKISNLKPSKKHKFESKEEVKDKKFELFLEKV